MGVNIKGLMMLGIAMIFLAVGFIIYPINLDATDAILAWTASDTLINLPGYDAGPPAVPATIDMYTGLEQVAGILPLIILLGFISAGAISGFMGVKMLKSGAGNVSPGGLMLLGIGMIFIAVSLIIFPVVMDGVAVAMDTALGGANTYTGLSPVLGVTPLIVLTAFMTGGIVASYFGIQSQRKAMA